MSVTSDRKVLIVLLDAARRDVTEELIKNSRFAPLAAATWFNCIAPSCWTVPSMASLLTGLYPAEHELGWPLRPPSSKRATLVQMLQQAGKSFLGLASNSMYAPPLMDLPPEVMQFPLSRYGRTETGLRRICGMLDYGGRTITDQVAGLARQGQAPDVVLAHLEEAHHPYLPPPQGLRGRCGYALGHVRYFSSARAQVWETAARSGEREWARARRLYTDCLRYDIGLLEELLKAYQDAGTLEQTLVIIIADHGEHLGEHGLADHQGSLYDELVSVPCALLAPGLSPGATPQGQFQHTDVVHTVLEYLGIESALYQPRWQPLNLLDKTLWGSGHEYAFMDWTAWGVEQLTKLQRRNPSFDFAAINRDLLGVRSREWKYIQPSRGEQMLFDLQADPQENSNVAAQRPDVVGQMQTQLAQWQAALAGNVESGGSEAATAYSEDEQRQIEQRLEDLGYM